MAKLIATWTTEGASTHSKKTQAGDTFRSRKISEAFAVYRARQVTAPVIIDLLKQFKVWGAFTPREPDRFSLIPGDNAGENRVGFGRNRCLAWPATRCLQKQHCSWPSVRTDYVGCGRRPRASGRQSASQMRRLLHEFAASLRL
ncbi:hypothetical protein AB4Z46_26965 [Variovorax sp. M-6]